MRAPFGAPRRVKLKACFSQLGLLRQQGCQASAQSSGRPWLLRLGPCMCPFILAACGCAAGGAERARQQGVAHAMSLCARHTARAAGPAPPSARRARAQKGERLELLRADAEQHFTRPPARFSEAGLVRALEERGIGRPSTYASTLSVLQARPHICASAVPTGRLAV